jgi:adenosylcobinamide-phosphate synthase
VASLIALLALLIEAMLGYPERLTRAIGHPVTWIGAIIAGLDHSLNRDRWSDAARRALGAATLLLVVAVAGGAGMAIEAALSGSAPGIVAAALLGSSLIAQRSLHRHVQAVALALASDGLDSGRRAVSHIVGRDPDRLDEAGVARAAIESLAENFSDGVVAPVLWMAAGGLGAAAAYKAVNTADSMIGHIDGRHAAFGWAAARCDDLVNLPASRLAALLLVAAAAFMPGASAAAAWRALKHDASRHRSPNAGWPEAAMAGALGLALAGPRTYAGALVDDAVMGKGGRRDAGAADIQRALRLFRIADLMFMVCIALLAGVAFMPRG